MPKAMVRLLVFPCALMSAACIDTSGLVFDRSNDDEVGYSAEVLSDGPLAYWPLDVVEGSRTPDMSGNGHDAFFDGGEMGTGTLELEPNGVVEGAATLFDEGRLFVSTPHPFAFGDRSYTLELWLLAAGTELSKIVTNTEPGSAGYSTFLSETSINHKRYDGTDFEDMGKSPVALAELRHVVITYDHDGALGQMYIDGAPQFPEGYPLSLSWQDPAAAFHLGIAGNGETLVIDEVAVYEGVLDAARIARHHCAAMPPCD